MSLKQPPIAPPAARNRLLGALPAALREEVERRGEFQTLEPLALLQPENETPRSVFFPLDCIISVLAITGDGEVEAGTVGNEGFAGIPVLLGGETTPMRVIMQVPGTVIRLDVESFRDLLVGNVAARPLLDRYVQYFLTQAMQSVGCNRAHSIERRCARWLLMTHDRVGRDQFLLTQEVLAQMLGVRRASVSEVASALQRAGLISYSRGRLTVRDRAGLERKACPCYERVQRELARLIA